MEEKDTARQSPQEELEKEYEELLQPPFFARLKQWWAAKKESVNLFGLGKLFGFDNTAFKKAIQNYKRAIREIESVYDEKIKGHGITTEEIEKVKKEHDLHLLKAKKEFVYSLPQNYREWFKRRRVFNSFISSPESWGFEETRYWGGRSGLSFEEKRFLFIGMAIIVLAFLAWFSKIHWFPEEEKSQATDAAAANP